MPYNNSVATSMYNTRSTSYMNRLSHDVGMAGDHAAWGEEDYVPTSCHTDSAANRINYKGRSSSPMMEVQQEQPEKKSTRKRANTTGSSAGDNKRTANKICRVCGDKAFSYNFNVITCESCKAFFRRNANKEKEIRCPFNEKCEINVVSRRFCQRCRLAKCFDVGMKKEWIMSDEARLEKKQRVEENRERRLQDALNRAGGEEDDEEDEGDDSNDSDGSMEDSPESELQNMSVCDYTMDTDSMQQPIQPHQPLQSHQPHQPHQPHHVQQMIQFPLKDEKTPTIYHNNSVEFSNHDYDFAGMTSHSSSNALLCHPHQVVDPIPTTGASSTADVSSTTTTIPSMDVDPTTTMTSNGFIPPSLTGLAEPAGGLLGAVQPEVDHSMMNVQAQVQLAAQVQHVQAALNHQQQQIAAAVVAQQVVAQMAVPSVQPTSVLPVQVPQPPQLPTIAPIAPIAPSLPQIAPNMAVMHHPIQKVMKPTLPPMGPTQIAKTNSPSVLINQINHSNSDMVTIPREVLMSLIQNNALRQMTCSCTCACGRYPPGSNIVEEVSKDLLNGGSSNSSSTDTQKDEAKLETAEDLQRNGLLPSEDTKVQWLNFTAPTVVDPSVYAVCAPDSNSTPKEETQTGRRDSTYNALLMDNTFSMLGEGEAREFAENERGKLEEINEVANRWINDNLDNYQLFDLFSDKCLRMIVEGLKILTPFRYMTKRNKKSLIINGLYAYCVVKWIQHHESMSLDGVDPELTTRLMRLLDMDIGNFRVQPGTFNTLAIVVLFEAEDMLLNPGPSRSHKDDYSKLLQKLIFSNHGDSQSLYDIIPEVHNAAALMQKSIGPIDDMLMNSFF